MNSEERDVLVAHLYASLEAVQKPVRVLVVGALHAQDAMQLLELRHVVPPLNVITKRSLDDLGARTQEVDPRLLYRLSDMSSLRKTYPQTEFGAVLFLPYIKSIHGGKKENVKARGSKDVPVAPRMIRAVTNIFQLLDSNGFALMRADVPAIRDGLERGCRAVGMESVYKEPYLLATK